MGEAPKPEKDERRRYVRLPYSLHVSYKAIQRDHVSEPESQIIEELGAGGLSMRVSEPQPPGRILMVDLGIPPAGHHYTEAELASLPEMSFRKVQILSRVAWCTSAPESGYMIGVQFLDLNLNDRIRLKDFLVAYQLDHPDSSLYK